MKIIFTFLALLTFGVVKAQTLVDSNLQQYARKALVEGIREYGDDVNQAGIIIIETKTGNVIANVSIAQLRGEIRDIPYGNFEPIPSGISRAVLYLSMVDTLGPNYIVDTGNGLYVDSISGCTITDISYYHGGFGALTLKKACDLSDIGIMKATEIAFKKNMGCYGAALRKTGIFFENYDDEVGYYHKADSWKYWSSCDIIGYKSPFSLIQQTAWVNMVANRGKLLLRLDRADSAAPICVVNNRTGLDSLASAMVEAVENGTGSKMRSKYMRVAGIVNVSPPDEINCRGCFAAAFFPYEKPQYTVGLFINKYDKPAGRIIPANIAGIIIDYMAKNHLRLKEDKEVRYHPCEK